MQNDETIAYNHVINTDPAIGRERVGDTEITPFVSNGPRWCRFPTPRTQLRRVRRRSAPVALTRSDDFSDTIPVGKVIGTNPAAGTSQGAGRPCRSR
jgi:beta-lactam-binding protein with PASTA domain